MGDVERFRQQEQFERNPFWADYQVLGPMLGAVSMLLGTQDIMPVMVGSRGCAWHTRLTMYAWGVDFGVRRRAVPTLDFTPKQIVSGNYVVGSEQMAALRRISEANSIHMAVLLPGDSANLAGDGLDGLSAQVSDGLGIPAPVLRVSPISGSNPWVGYDQALGLIYDEVSRHATAPGKRPGVNLFGWKWPSREQDYDVGTCLRLLEQLQVPVNHVLPGGASLADFADSLRSQVNLLWCSSYIGPTLHRLEDEGGLKLAGLQTPYGFTGTLQWIDELAAALDDPKVAERGRAIASQHQPELEELRNELRGKRVFVSGGPGRILGLLHAMMDLELEVVAVGLYWIHSELRAQFEQVLAQLPRPPKKLLVTPSLYELDQVAEELRPDVWLGGYQELHPCKKHNIPFVPTTLYIKSHQAFEGCIRLGNKMVQAINGYDFVVNPFMTKEMTG